MRRCRQSNPLFTHVSLWYKQNGSAYRGLLKAAICGDKAKASPFLGPLGSRLVDKDNKYDRIAMLFVYMPTIRFIIQDKVSRYNNHHIRKQKKYPDAVVGVPEEMYFSPEDYGATHHALVVDPA